jgi:tRNA nucleotidyltransferase (CCA-adding enzyme)
MQALKSAKSWNVAIHVVKKLQSEGHEAVFAGGCVRDALLGLASSDIDVATSALPDEVEALFSKT